MGTGARPDPGSVFGAAATLDFGPIATAHNFILGFAVARKSTSGPYRDLSVRVLRFPDPGAAGAAASEFAAKSLTRDPENPRRPIPVPGHADANSCTGDFTDVVTHEQRSVVVSYTAHGSYVLSVSSAAAEGTAAATQLVAGTLDRQKPLIDRFYAADPATFAELPRDPTGLLARTLPYTGKYDYDPNLNADYEPRAELMFQTDPVNDGKLFSQAGVQHIATGKTTVYQANDGVAAGQLLDGFVDEANKQTPRYRSADNVEHLPGSKCLVRGGKNPGTIFTCYVVAERYLIEASSAQLADVHQQTAAQYRMLVTK